MVFFKKLLNSGEAKEHNVQRAQILYYINNANYFTMMRSGNYAEYKALDIPKELEWKWSRDIKNKLFKKIVDNNDFGLLHTLAEIENLDESEMLACFQFFAESDNAHDVWVKIESNKEMYSDDRYEKIKQIFDSKKEIDTEKAQQLLRVTIQRYNAFFRESLDGEVYLLTYGETETKRKALYMQLDADFEDFRPFAMGETVSGRNGIAVLLYPFNMWRENDFYNAAYQEFGHFIFQKRNVAIFREEKKFSSERTKKCGYDLLNAFIAKVTINLLSEKPIHANSEDCLKAVSRQLYRALPGINPENTSDRTMQKWDFLLNKIKVIPDALGIYCAMILTDSIIVDLMQKDPRVERGFSACNQQTAAIVEDVTKWLANYLKKHPDYTCTEEELSTLGEMILRLEQSR